MALSFFVVYLLNTIPNSRIFYVSIYLVSVFGIYCLNVGQGLDVNNMRYRINLAHSREYDSLEFVKENPLRYIDGTRFFTDYVAMAYPKQIHPPMSSIYGFPAWQKLCKPVSEAIVQASEHVLLNLDQKYLSPHSKSIQDRAKWQIKIASEIHEFDNKCSNNIDEILGDKEFQIFEVASDLIIFIHFSNLPFIRRQGIDF